MWLAYKKLRTRQRSTCNRLIDIIRRKTREDLNQDKITHEEICQVDNGNRCGQWKHPLVEPSGVELVDNAFWQSMKSKLTEN
ncbi:hypothetical protein [Virgibacillus doumboii]|uniref:hypothetical protein n=1 Tax=Virgibacillus doumboii TaxID=2697503 RepID=UPI0013DFC93A|nr:hypothetical protein [Virgibacillus doumboii]